MLELSPSPLFFNKVPNAVYSTNTTAESNINVKINCTKSLFFIYFKTFIAHIITILIINEIAIGNIIKIIISNK